MAHNSGFFKGEKKKKKKGSVNVPSGGFAPVFVPPTIINKGKKPS